MRCYRERRSIFWARHLAHRLVRRLKSEGAFPHGVRLAAFPDDLIGRELALAGTYEPAGIGLIRWLCQSGVVSSAEETAFVDVGANIGVYSLQLNDNFKEVIAFEPHPITCKILKLNIDLNGARNIRVEQIALSDSCGVADLMDDFGDNIGASSLEDGRSNELTGCRNTVTLEPGAQAIAQVTSHRISVVKIDVEGHELKVVEGLAPLLARDRPILAFEANSPAASGQLEARLRELGYMEFVALDYIAAIPWLWLRVIFLTSFGVRYTARSIHTLSGKYSLVFALQAEHAEKWKRLTDSTPLGGWRTEQG